MRQVQNQNRRPIAAGDFGAKLANVYNRDFPSSSKVRISLCPHFDGETTGVKRGQAFQQNMREHSNVGLALDDNRAIEFVDDTYRVITSKAGASVYKLVNRRGVLSIARIVQREKHEPITVLLQSERPFGAGRERVQHHPDHHSQQKGNPHAKREVPAPPHRPSPMWHADLWRPPLPGRMPHLHAPRAIVGSVTIQRPPLCLAGPCHTPNGHGDPAM